MQTPQRKRKREVRDALDESSARFNAYAVAAEEKQKLSKRTELFTQVKTIVQTLKDVPDENEDFKRALNEEMQEIMQEISTLRRQEKDRQEKRCDCINV